jgi:hypothetical protein
MIFNLYVPNNQKSEASGLQGPKAEAISFMINSDSNQKKVSFGFSVWEARRKIQLICVVHNVFMSAWASISVHSFSDWTDWQGLHIRYTRLSPDISGTTFGRFVCETPFADQKQLHFHSANRVRICFRNSMSKLHRGMRRR